MTLMLGNLNNYFYYYYIILTQINKLQSQEIPNKRRRQKVWLYKTKKFNTFNIKNKKNP